MYQLRMAPRMDDHPISPLAINTQTLDPRAPRRRLYSLWLGIIKFVLFVFIRKNCLETLKKVEKFQIKFITQVISVDKRGG